MATCNPGCLLNFADIMAAIANDGTATVASTCTPEKAEEETTKEGEKRAEEEECVEEEGKGGEEGGGGSQGEEEEEEPTQSTWDVHIQSSTDSTKYAYFDPDGNKFDVGSIPLGDNFTSNTTGWFKFNVTHVTSNPDTVTGQIVTNAISSPNYYLTLTTAHNLEFAPESESGGIQNFTFTFDGNGNNFNISGSITPTSGTTPTTYYIAENTSNTLLPQTAKPTGGYNFKFYTPAMLLTYYKLQECLETGTDLNFQLTLMNSKGSYAFYQPSGEQFHVGDPGEICVGQDITDNTTAYFTLVGCAGTTPLTCRIKTNANKDHYLTINGSKISFRSVSASTACTVELQQLQGNESGGSQMITFNPTCTEDGSYTLSSVFKSETYYIGVKKGILIPSREPSDAVCFSCYKCPT